MSRDSDFNKGEAPDAGEVLVAALAIAGLTKTLQERAAALQDETARTLRLLVAMRDEVQQRLDVQSQEMRQRFDAQAQEIRRINSPQAVQAAVDGARQVLGDFRSSAAGAADQLKRQLDAATKPLSLRIAGVAAAPIAFVLLGILGVVGFAKYFVPGLDEVRARRAVMAAQPVQPIDYQGGKWVPVAAVQELCDQNDPKKCRRYGRIK